MDLDEKFDICNKPYSRAHEASHFLNFKLVLDFRVLTPRFVVVCYFSRPIGFRFDKDPACAANNFLQNCAN